MTTRTRRLLMGLLAAAAIVIALALFTPEGDNSGPRLLDGTDLDDGPRDDYPVVVPDFSDLAPNPTYPDNDG